MGVCCTDCEYLGIIDLGGNYIKITCVIGACNEDGKCDKYVPLDWSDMFTAEDFEESKLVNLDDEDEIPF